MFKSLSVVVSAMVLVTMSIVGIVTAQEPIAVFDGHFELPETGIYPEGIAYDPTQQVFFVGSAVDGTILRGDVSTGDISVFVEAGRDGNTSVTGMKVDAQRRLWVAGAETRYIFVYDAASAELIRRYEVPPAPVSVVGFFTGGEEVPANLVNDLTIAPNGDVYLTDSYSDLLYRIESGQELGELEVWLTELGGGFVNGIAVSPNGNTLLVALAEAGGLLHVDISTKIINHVTLEGGLLFGDGLLFDRDDSNILYSTNFLPDGRSTIARISFENKDYSVGTVVEAFIVDETFAVITTLAQVDNHLLAVNSQMFTYFDPSLEPVRPWIISNVEIPQDL